MYEGIILRPQGSQVTLKLSQLAKLKRLQKIIQFNLKRIQDYQLQ